MYIGGSYSHVDRSTVLGFNLLIYPSVTSNTQVTATDDMEVSAVLYGSNFAS